MSFREALHFGLAARRRLGRAAEAAIFWLAFPAAAVADGTWWLLGWAPPCVRRRRVLASLLAGLLVACFELAMLLLAMWRQAGSALPVPALAQLSFTVQVEGSWRGIFGLALSGGCMLCLACALFVQKALCVFLELVLLAPIFWCGAALCASVAFLRDPGASDSDSADSD